MDFPAGNVAALASHLDFRLIQRSSSAAFAITWSQLQPAPLCIGVKPVSIFGFWSAYLVAAQTPGVSALELQKRLGIARYETAFQILHKLRAAMIRPDRDKIGVEWPVELDVVFVGGKHKGGQTG